MRRTIALLLALVLLAAGALLLRRGADWGVYEESQPLPDGGKGTLYSASPLGDRLPSVYDGEADTHDHGLPSRNALGALLLAGRRDGSANLARELARRGITVLAVPEESDAFAAWDILSRRLDSPFLALLGGEAALALLKEGTITPACAVLWGGADELASASSLASRNILFLSPDEPESAVLRAFLGEEERKSGAVGGYFAEGTARRAVRPVSGRRDSRESLLPVIDWLGSSLGHAVEIADEDLLGEQNRTYTGAGALCLALGAALAGIAALSFRKRRNHP